MGYLRNIFSKFMYLMHRSRVCIPHTIMRVLESHVDTDNITNSGRVKQSTRNRRYPGGEKVSLMSNRLVAVTYGCGVGVLTQCSS